MSNESRPEKHQHLKRCPPYYEIGNMVDEETPMVKVAKGV